MALQITTENFEEMVLNSDKPVLVDFWAEWCGPCRMVGPIVDELHTEYEGKAIVGKVNVDDHKKFLLNMEYVIFRPYYFLKVEKSLIKMLVLHLNLI